MRYYTFHFIGDYHLKPDGSHEIKLIYVDKSGNETAYCEGESVPEYCTEITKEDLECLIN